MNFKVVPNWKKIVLSTVGLVCAANGIYALVSIQIPNGLDRFAAGRAISRQLVEPVTKEVPTIKTEDVKTQISEGVNQAVKESFK